MLKRRLAAELMALALIGVLTLSATAYDSRPWAWCGWWMRHQVARDPGPAFNLARRWAAYGSPARGPAPGVIGVLPHHVFKVVQVLGAGKVLAISGNDGHAVRTRPRSTAGVIAWRSEGFAVFGDAVPATH